MSDCFLPAELEGIRTSITAVHLLIVSPPPLLPSVKGAMSPWSGSSFPIFITLAISSFIAEIPKASVAPNWTKSAVETSPSSIYSMSSAADDDKSPSPKFHVAT